MKHFTIVLLAAFFSLTSLASFAQSGPGEGGDVESAALKASFEKVAALIKSDSLREEFKKDLAKYSFESKRDFISEPLQLLLETDGENLRSVVLFHNLSSSKFEHKSLTFKEVAIVLVGILSNERPNHEVTVAEKQEILTALDSFMKAQASLVKKIGIRN